MNTGVIATRYARALLKYTASTGRGEAVYVQVAGLLKDSDHIPSPLEPDLQKFIALVMNKHREELLREIFVSFVSMYRKENGIKLAHLTTAVAAPGLEKQLERILREDSGCKVIMETKVDPSIMGGFVFTVDDMMLDASVKRQIELVCRKFIEKNRRIV